MIFATEVNYIQEVKHIECSSNRKNASSSFCIESSNRK